MPFEIDPCCWLNVLEELGKELTVPVIPVSALEAQLFSVQPRGYPFVSLVSTLNETQSVLTHGVGDHEILGMDLDNTAETTIQKFSHELHLSLRLMHLELHSAKVSKEID